MQNIVFNLKLRNTASISRKSEKIMRLVDCQKVEPVSHEAKRFIQLFFKKVIFQKLQVLVDRTNFSITLPTLSDYILAD